MLHDIEGGVSDVSKTMMVYGADVDGDAEVDLVMATEGNGVYAYARECMCVYRHMRS